MMTTSLIASNAAITWQATMSDFEYSLACRPGLVCPCREAERAAIVAWLHMQEGRQTFGDLARAVEHGEHLRGDDE